MATLTRRRQRPKTKALTITLSAILVLISRALFFFHSLFTAWRVVDKIGSLYLLVGIAVICSAIEIFWVLIKRRAKEWTWFSIHVFLYLITVVPGIWLLRLEQINEQRHPETANCNKTLLIGTQIANCNETVADAVEVLSTKFGVTIPLSLKASTWLQILPQSLIFILIITRWIAPFGRASHRKLSELLLVYVGLGSDIVELFALYDEDYVIKNNALTYWILGAWTLSLTQFMLPLTGAIAPSDKKEIDKTPGAFQDCMRNEAWTIMAIVLLQDGPFMMIRLYIMIALGHINYNLGFFVVKNIFVICLQLYRFLVLAFCVDPVTGGSFRRRRKPQTVHSNTGCPNRSISIVGDGVAGLDTSDVVVIEEAEKEEDEEGSEVGDIEDQGSTPRQSDGYTNDAYSRDSLDATA